MRVQGYITKVEKRKSKKGKDFQRIKLNNIDYSEVVELCYFGNATLQPDPKKLLDVDISILGNPMIIAEFNEPMENKDRKPLTSVKV
jgi:hypothetical protein